MKQLLLTTSLLFIFTISFASHYVNSYSRSNGEFVEGHESMDPGESESTGLSYTHNTIVTRGDYDSI